MDDFDLDPEAVRRLGYRAADLVADHRAGLLQKPVFGKVGDAAALFDEPLPEDGQPIEAVLEAVRDRVLAHPFGNSHPRFFAFINATADPVGHRRRLPRLAMNSNCWGGDHASIHVERRVVAWLAEILGLPATAEGILTSGGSMANFTALATARRAVAPGVRRTASRARPRSSSTSRTRSTTAWTRPWTSSASGGSSCARSRRTTAAASGWTC